MRSRRGVGIRVAGVTVVFGSIRALDGVSVEVGEGEFAGIIGPNGAGKTTLLRCIYRAVKPVAGAVFICGRDASGLGRRELAKLVASAPTEIPGEFNLTVADVILLGRHPHARSWWEGPEDLAKVADVAERLGISHLLERGFSTLSSGEKRKVLIAKALVQEPKVLLADEPTSNLDLRAQVEVAEILREAADEGVTVIATFHDLNIASRFCDKLIAMKAGRIAAVGRPEDVIRPEVISRVYGVEAEVIRCSDGLVVVPRRSGGRLRAPA